MVFLVAVTTAVDALAAYCRRIADSGQVQSTSTRQKMPYAATSGWVMAEHRRGWGRQRVATSYRSTFVEFARGSKVMLTVNSQSNMSIKLWHPSGSDALGRYLCGKDSEASCPPTRLGEWVMSRRLRRGLGRLGPELETVRQRLILSEVSQYFLRHELA